MRLADPRHRFRLRCASARQAAQLWAVFFPPFRPEIRITKNELRSKFLMRYQITSGSSTEMLGIFCGEGHKQNGE
jgi:hypothetical protein